MKRSILIGLFLALVPICIRAQGTLSPINPTVTQSGQVTISCTANCGTGSSWTCPGCAGTLSNQTATTVLYTAPAAITPCQMVGGYQLLPCDHILNTNISSFSVHASSVHWLFDGMYGDNFSMAPPPALSCSNSGGSLATATYFIKYTYNWAFGAGLPSGSTGSSSEASCSLTGPSGSVTVTAPFIPANIQSYTVYSGTSSGAEKQQTASAACVAITTNCTIQVVGAGANVPANAYSAAGNMGMISLFPQTGINYLTAFPVNYTTGSTPTRQMAFYYTPTNNGAFETPDCPNFIIESGCFDASSFDSPDHHGITFHYPNDAFAGNISERYQNYFGNIQTSAADVGISGGTNIATLTFPVDLRPIGFYLSSTTICVGSFSGADTYFNVCPVTGTRTSPTTVTYPLTHANATATSNGFITAQTNAGPACVTAGTCTSQSGDKYNAFTYTLLNGIGTDAASLPLLPLILRAQETKQAFSTAGDIKHALRVTFNNTFNCLCFAWPATANATTVSGFLPYGARFRLKSSFPNGSFSANDQVLLRNLENYGLVNADGGNQWQIITESGSFPQSVKTTFNDLAGATKNSTITNTAVSNHVATILASNDFAAGYGVKISGTSNGAGCLNSSANVPNGSNHQVIAATSNQFQVFTNCANFGSAGDSGTAAAILPNYFDIVDESGQMESSNSGAAINGETVTYTSSTGTARDNIALEGPAIGFTVDTLYVFGGTPAKQLPVVATNGNSNCSMNPSIGTLTAGGFYTAPATVTTASSIAVTCSNMANSSAVSQMTVWVVPNRGFRFTQGTLGADFTDTDGNIWTSGYGLGFSNETQWTGSNSPDNSFPHINNYQLWYSCMCASIVGPVDGVATVWAPQGNYQVTLRVDSAANNIATDILDVQGQHTMGPAYAAMNVPNVAGGIHLPFSFTTQTTVASDNVLTVNTYAGAVGSLSIVPGGDVKAVGNLP